MASADQLESARRALAQGELLLAQGRNHAARLLLDYAARFVPDDDHVVLQAARARLADGDAAGALILLTPLSEKFHRRELWVIRASAERANGDREAAARSVQRLLSVFTVTESLTPFLDDVAAGVGAAGWCGLDGDGRLLVSGAGIDRSSAMRRFVVMADGRSIQIDTETRLLPPEWIDWRALTVRLDDLPLLGGTFEPPAIQRIEGFVAADNGGIRGWAWAPGQPDRDPVLRLTGPNGEERLIQAVNTDIDASHTGLLSRPRGFYVSGLSDGAWRITTPAGQELTGSPVDPAWLQRSVMDAAVSVKNGEGSGRYAVMQTGVCPPRIAATPARRPVDIVIPVYRNLNEVWACLQTLLGAQPPDSRIVVVEDASPEPALVSALETLAGHGKIILLRQPRNRGFPATANAGMRHAAGRDVVLLNSDTLMPPGWLQRLQSAAYSEADIGTVTPFANDATILSYPSAHTQNAVPTLAEVVAFDQAAQRANGDSLCEIPVAVGFCMYIRHDCLEQTGWLREDIFGQGYGEEVDFCLRATALGWRHMAHTGVFAGHISGSSFGGAKNHLIRRNGDILNLLHPGFDAVVARFEQDDPLSSRRRDFDLARLGRHGRAIVMIGHALKGGVGRHIAERAGQWVAEGYRPLLLAPATDRNGAVLLNTCQLIDPADRKNAFPNLVFHLPDEWDALLAVLRSVNPVACEWHHFIGHHPAVATLHRALAIPQTMTIHDYALFCPRVTLTKADGRYCGEPDVRQCDYCVADLGDKIDENISVQALRERSDEWLRAASHVIAPSADTARRIEGRFPGVRAVVAAWEDVKAGQFRAGIRSGDDPVRVCVPGAIGQEKGFELLLACVRDAADRKRPIQFVLTGFSRDDRKLLEAGPIEITGPYAEGDALAVMAAQKPDIGFLPSLWPETWSYTLSDMIRLGLPVVAFDIGAQAARVIAAGGLLIPLDTAPSSVNEALIGFARKSCLSDAHAKSGGF